MIMLPSFSPATLHRRLIHLDGQHYQGQSELMAGEKVKEYSYRAGLLHGPLTHSIGFNDLRDSSQLKTRCPLAGPI
jgi:hypothetical protein